MSTVKTLPFANSIKRVEIMKAMEKEIESHSIQSQNSKSKQLDAKELHKLIREIEEEKLFNQSSGSESQYSLCANAVIHNSSRLHAPTLQPFEEESVQLSDSPMSNGLNDSRLLGSTPSNISPSNVSEDASGKPLDIGGFNESTSELLIPLSVNHLSFSECSKSTELIISSLSDKELSTYTTLNTSALDDSEPVTCTAMDVYRSNSSQHTTLSLLRLSDTEWEVKVKEALKETEMARMEMKKSVQLELSEVRRNLVSLKEELRSTIRAIDQLALRNLDSDGDATTIEEGLPSEYYERSHLDSELENTLTEINRAKAEALIHCVREVEKSLTSLSGRKRISIPL